MAPKAFEDLLEAVEYLCDLLFSGSTSSAKAADNGLAAKPPSIKDCATCDCLLAPPLPLPPPGDEVGKKALDWRRGCGSVV